MFPTSLGVNLRRNIRLGVGGTGAEARESDRGRETRSFPKTKHINSSSAQLSDFREKCVVN